MFAHPKQNEIKSIRYFPAVLQRKTMKELWSPWPYFPMEKQTQASAGETRMLEDLRKAPQHAVLHSI